MEGDPSASNASEANLPLAPGDDAAVRDSAILRRVAPEMQALTVEEKVALVNRDRLDMIASEGKDKEQESGDKDSDETTKETR